MESPFSNSYRHFTVQWRESAAIVHIRGPKLHDPLDIAEFRDELCTFVQVHQPGHLLLNFAAVLQCSSESISVMLSVRKLIQAYGGRMGLCGLRDTVREAYRILNLDGIVFTIFGSVTEALAIQNSARCSIVSARPTTN